MRRFRLWLLRWFSIGLLSGCCYGGDRRSWAWSATFVMGATTADIASSRGQRELNPVLGYGDFGARQVSIKLAITSAVLGAEWLLMRKHPEMRRPWTRFNYAAAGVTGAVAARNWRIK